MKLKSQICSLKSAKKLDKLGVTYRSLFIYVNNELGMRSKVVPLQYMSFPDEMSPEFQPDDEIINAYTASELGAMLISINPSKPPLPFVEDYPHTQKLHWKFLNPFTEYAEDKCVLEPIDEISEAEARARALLYFFKYKLITAEEINKEAK